MSPLEWEDAISSALNGLDAVVFNGYSPARCDCESVLARQGLALPLQHTSVWLGAHPGDVSWLVALRGPQGMFSGGVGLGVIAPRSLPGHVILRAERLGTTVVMDDVERLLAALHALSLATPRILQLDIELFSRSPAFHNTVGLIALRFGWQPVQRRRRYTRTLIVDLAKPEDALLESFHRTVRKCLRKTDKLGHQARPITDQRYACRIDNLYQETMARTGGPYAPLPWELHIEFSRNYPDLSRIVGLFLDGRDEPESLAAVRWCGIHGDHAQDLIAASTRIPQVPVMHAVMWDQLRWARAAGAAWFDFGGIPDGTVEPDDPLASISDFKRLFTHQDETVGGEWSLRRRSARGFVASLVRGVATAARGVAKKLRQR